jgi:hypothetical protein
MTKKQHRHSPILLPSSEWRAEEVGTQCPAVEERGKLFSSLSCVYGVERGQTIIMACCVNYALILTGDILAKEV